MGRLEIIQNYSLASFTTFNLGGPARYFASVRSESEVLAAIDFTKSRGIPIFVLGGGSNVLINDVGLSGLVILNRIRGFRREAEDEHSVVYAGSGEDWQELVDWCVSDNLQGIECLAGIPGSVGASAVQNIGAYGQDVSETIIRVSAIELGTGNPFVFSKEDCLFGYRTSIFNSNSAEKYIITGITFRLNRNGKPAILHSEIENRLRGNTHVTIQQVRDSIISTRESKGLLVRKGYEGFRSGGSFFKNPTVSEEKFQEVEERVQKAGGCTRWAWPADSGRVKISAACLIQTAGFGRGYRKGNVGLSPRHTLIIVAYDGATAQEVVDFAGEVQKKVKETFGVLLKPEVQLVGFPPSCLNGA